MPIPVGEARGPAAGAATPSMISVNGIRIEMIERGSGRPLLFLHPGIGIDAGVPVPDRLAGVGAAEGPRHMTAFYALAYFYLALMRARAPWRSTPVGVSSASRDAWKIA